jgi:tetratricopeptide (TPR) repeat protein
VAIAHLSRYTASHPQDGKAHELLGRAYFADGQLDRAEASLAAALRADPSLRGTVRYYQASIANARGERAQANALLVEALRADPRSPLSLRILRPSEVPGAARPVAKPWNALVALAAGYNDNVLLVDDSGLTLPTDVTTNDTQALFAAVDTHYTFAGFGHDIVRLGYAGRFARYLDVSQGNYADNGVYGIYAHSVVPELEAAIRTGVSRTAVGGNTFRTAFELRPAVTWRATDYATVELALTRYEFDFEAQPTNVQRDRDSTQVAVGFNVSIVPPADVWQIRPRFGYARIDNDAVGSDYDFAADSVYVGINFTPGFDVTVDLLFAATNADYDHPNSFASNGTVLNAFERSDRTHSITIDVSKPILDDVDAFGTVAYRRNTSNIGLFQYHQHESVAGARIRF